MRPYWRLPFDRMSPFELVSNTTAMLINIAPNYDALNPAHLWYLDQQNFFSLLDTLSLLDSQHIESCWMIPSPVEKGGEMAYVFMADFKSVNLAKQQIKTGVPQQVLNHTVYGFNTTTADPLYLVRVHNLLLAAKYPFQLEPILSLLKKEQASWLDEAQFASLQAQFDKQAYQVLIKNDALEFNVPDYWLAPSQRQELQKHFEWMGFSLSATDSTASLQAYCIAQDSLQVEQQMNWTWVPDISTRATPKWIDETKISTQWQRYIAPWLGAGCMELELERKQENTQATQIWALPIANEAAFKTAYSALQEELGLLERDDYQSFELLQIAASDIFFPISDRRGMNPWLCVIDGAVLCAVAKEDLERWIDYYMVGASVQSSTDFLLQEQVVGKANALFRWQTDSEQQSNLFKLLYPDADWASYAQCLVAFEQKDRAIFAQANIKKHEPKIKGPAIAWTSPLTIAGNVKLHAVEHLYTGQQMAMVLQNEGGHIQFLDGQGNVFWEQQDSKALIGKLYAQPVHNNLYYLIGLTEDGIQYWDENGQQLDRFPQVYAGPSASLQVLRYRAQEANLMLATQDGLLWSISSAGVTAPDWPIQAYADSSAVQGLLHYQLPTQDLLVTWADTLGWKVFNKEGKLSFSVDKLEGRPISPPFGQQLTIAELPPHNRLLMVYDNGVAQVINFKGEHFSLPLGKGPVDRFLLTSVWGDARADYLVQRSKLVHLFAYEGTVFTERWKHYFSAAPDTLINMAPWGVVAQNYANKEIWLLDGQGKLLSDYPLPSDQPALVLQTEESGNLLISLFNAELYAYVLD